MNIQEQEERDYCPESPFNLEMAETRMFGETCPDRPWLLSDFDVWVKNPYYHGPEVPHPEYDDYDMDSYEDDYPDEVDSFDDAEFRAILSADTGIPF